MPPMTQIIAPIAEITAEQIGRLSDRFSERCRKNKVSLPKDTVQLVLEQEGGELAQEQFEALRKRVERRSEMIVRHFKVDRTKTREQMITALKRTPYVDAEVLATMPTDGKDEGDLYFFPGKRTIPALELAREFEYRGLVPYPLAQMQVNIDDKSFADEHPNGVQWLDTDDNPCFATFYRWYDERKVSVSRRGFGWDGHWWFAGVRKQNQS